jgi:hypothetical protein
VLTDVHGANHLLQVKNLLAGQKGLQGGSIVAGRPPHDLNLFVAIGVSHLNHEQETIELCFGQRVGSFLFDGFLRRQHEERVGQSVGMRPSGDMVLLRVASGRAACSVLGRVRMISSAKIMLEKSGPFKRNGHPTGLRVFLKDVSSVMSAGIRWA